MRIYKGVRGGAYILKKGKRRYLTSKKQPKMTRVKNRKGRYTRIRQRNPTYGVPAMNSYILSIHGALYPYEKTIRIPHNIVLVSPSQCGMETKTYGVREKLKNIIKDKEGKGSEPLFKIIRGEEMPFAINVEVMNTKKLFRYFLNEFKKGRNEEEAVDEIKNYKISEDDLDLVEFDFEYATSTTDKEYDDYVQTIKDENLILPLLKFIYDRYNVLEILNRDFSSDIVIMGPCTEIFNMKLQTLDLILGDKGGLYDELENEHLKNIKEGLNGVDWNGTLEQVMDYVSKRTEEGEYAVIFTTACRKFMRAHRKISPEIINKVYDDENRIMNTIRPDMTNEEIFRTIDKNRVDGMCLLPTTELISPPVKKKVDSVSSPSPPFNFGFNQ